MPPDDRTEPPDTQPNAVPPPVKTDPISAADRLKMRRRLLDFIRRGRIH